MEVTDTFLSDYFFDLFGRVNFATLDDFRVMYVNSEFSRDEPNEIEFTAVAFFDKDSPTIPTENDLDVLLRQAFVGASLANYTRLVQDLPDDNPFSTTSRVAYSNSTTASKSTVQGNQELTSGKKGAIVAASAVIAVVGIFIGAFIYRKRRTDQDERKSLVHGHFSFGDTVVTSTDDRTLESLPQDQNLHSLRNRTNSGGYVDDEFESLADSSSYTSRSATRSKRPPMEPMLYDDELPDDLPSEYAVTSSSTAIPSEGKHESESGLVAAMMSSSAASVSNSSTSSSEDSTDSGNTNESPRRPSKPPPSARNLKASL